MAMAARKKCFMLIFSRISHTHARVLKPSFLEEAAPFQGPIQSTLYPGREIPPFSPVYTGTKVILSPQVSPIKDSMVLNRYFNLYKDRIQEHNESISAPEMMIHLGDAFSLIWRYPGLGWDEKIFQLLMREKIQISLQLHPILDFIPEMCYWVGIPHYLTANTDASLKTRAIGVVFRQSEGYPIRSLCHQLLPAEHSTIEEGELFGILRAVEMGRGLLLIGLEQGWDCEKGLAIMCDNQHMISMLNANTSMKKKSATAVSVNGLLRNIRANVEAIERMGKHVLFLYVRRESNALADFLSIHDVTDTDSGPTMEPLLNTQNRAITAFQHIVDRDIKGALSFIEGERANIHKLCGIPGVEFAKRKRIL